MTTKHTGRGRHPSDLSARCSAGRLALVSQRADVGWMIPREGLQLGLAGVGIGITAALGLTRLLAGFLYGAVPAGAGNLGVTTLC
jgi:hypothetical protein